VIDRFEAGGVHETVGALSKDIRVRVLNCSPVGCLLESNSPVAVGTVAALSVMFGDREFADSVQVVRCQSIGSTRGIYHLGAEFLTTAPPYAGSLRYAMRREGEALVGRLNTNNRP
jgi:hypothetical protein